jgi:hypothetical protein
MADPVPAPAAPPISPETPTPPVPAPILPPQARRKLPIPLILIGILVGELLLIILIVLAVFRPRRATPPPLLPLPTPPSNQEVTVTPVSRITPEVARLPLTDLAGRNLVLASGSDLWLFEFTTQGPRKSQLAKLDGRVADLAVSPNGKYLAVTFAPTTADFNGPQYPKTGLLVIDLLDPKKADTELIPLDTKSVRHPVWSSDSLYLGVWNDGQSLNLFDIAAKTTRLDIVAPAGTQVGPPVFVPKKAMVSYVQGGTLYQSDYTGTRTAVTDGLNAVRSIQGRSQLPNPHHYSPNANFVAFHDSLGQLVVLDIKGKTRQILAEWAKNQDIADKFSYGAPVFFDTLNTLVYYDLRKASYSPGVDDNPVFVYSPTKKASTPFFPNPKTPVNLVSLLPLPDQDKFLIHDTGFRVYKSNSDMLANCDYTGFTYAYYSAGGGIDYTSPLKVWTSDGEYIFSLGTNQVADVSSCAVSAPFDSQRFEFSIWTK